MPIIRFNKDAHKIEAENFNPAVNLCLPCSNKIAFEWKVGFEDLDYLMVSIQTAKAGKCGVPPTKEEVWNYLEKLGVRRIESRDFRPAKLDRPIADSAVPVGDR
jgi:hypothetical protein